MALSNPRARYRELGVELRRCREEAGLSGAELAARTGWSPTMISRIEHGRFEISPVDAIQYLGFCGIHRADTLEPVVAMCRDAERKLGYWLSPHGEWLEDSLAALIYHESTAVRSTIYEPLLVHGLLQTEDYARARIATTPILSPEEIDRAVCVRMDRQRVLDLRYPAEFVFFLHEQALHIEVGSPAIMHEQMLKLVLVAALAHITVRVVPSVAGERSAFGGPFAMFEYKEYAPLVYLDNVTTGLFLEDKEYVESFRDLVPAISEVALSEGQSRELIATLASEYDQRSERDAVDLLEEEQL